MSESINALRFILIAAAMIFWICGKYLPAEVTDKEFKKWRNVWFIAILIPFFSFNYWLYIILSMVFIHKTVKRDENKIAYYFLLLFIVPPMGGAIPGFGIMDHLFEINHPRMLSLVILLPAYLKYKQREDAVPLGKLLSDKILISLLVYITVMQLRDTSPTDALRRGFVLFTDMFLPYFVVSRYLTTVKSMKIVATSWTVVVFIASLLAVMEYLKSWPLFIALPYTLGSYGFGGYMIRAGGIRAFASLGHPLVLGLILAASFSAFLIVCRDNVKVKRMRHLGMFLIIAGLFATGSRGPWMGGLCFAAVFAICGEKPTKQTIYMAVATLLIILTLPNIPGGEKYYNMLPFIGKAETDNVDYRKQLFTNASIVISRNPLFGDVNCLKTPEMEAMRQGEGIIDLVNEYLTYALFYGYVGLSMFIGFFVSVLYGMYKAQQKIKNINKEMFYIGRCLIASLVSILFTITTTSCILVIYFFLYTVAGMGVAYTIIVRKALSARNNAQNVSIAPSPLLQQHG